MEIKKNKINKVHLIMLVGIFCVITFTLSIFVFHENKTTVSQTSFSKRATEFMRANADNQDNLMRSIDLTPKPQGGEKEYTIGDCFSIKIPYYVTNVKHIKHCSDWFFIDDPKGNLTAYVNSFNGFDYEDDSGVHMRRLNKELYKESVFESNGKKILIFRKMGDEFEQSAFYLENNQMFVVNLFSNTNADLSKDLLKILSSMQIENRYENKDE